MVGPVTTVSLAMKLPLAIVLCLLIVMVFCGILGKQSADDPCPKATNTARIIGGATFILTLPALCWLVVAAVYS
jgi:hypothetical protein